MGRGADADAADRVSWRELIDHARGQYRHDLDGVQRLIVRILLWLSLPILTGLALTGVWQFFTHAPDPTWFPVEPDMIDTVSPAAERPGAALHGMFSTLAGMLLLIGGGVFAFRVAYRYPRALVLALALTVVGIFTGHFMRFNVIKPADGPPTSERGYLQVFEGGNEYILTDYHAYSTAQVVVLTLLHLAVLPLLVLTARYGLRRLSRPDPDDHSRSRVGWNVHELARRPTDDITQADDRARARDHGATDTVLDRRDPDEMWRRPSA